MVLAKNLLIFCIVEQKKNFFEANVKKKTFKNMEQSHAHRSKDINLAVKHKL